MFLRLLIPNKQLTTLAVTLGLLLRDPHDRKDAVAFPEDGIHFFQGAVGGFGVEEPDAGDDEGVSGFLFSY